ncbi:hypothetical protein F0L74_29580 [Chitinophaga agrisoli]|uniref:Uncharacterized protein n=1 Tax=Chitinophaga agrisoli TaxID=2607653 RepID=A0A5B2VMT4_9BACT|nr:hypothetical protein [Chitinophaga agrisoli]KAA2240315.1 hypothetical protein F0L74_29580 [Chitinophaga agrisoli]
MKLTDRLLAPTPPFFAKVRNIGLILTAVSSAVLGLPVLAALPAIIGKVAAYLAVAGTVMSGISQTAVDTDAD